MNINETRIEIAIEAIKIKILVTLRFISMINS